MAFRNPKFKITVLNTDSPNESDDEENQQIMKVTS